MPPYFPRRTVLLYGAALHLLLGWCCSWASTCAAGESCHGTDRPIVRRRLRSAFVAATSFSSVRQQNTDTNNLLRQVSHASYRERLARAGRRSIPAGGAGRVAVFLLQLPLVGLTFYMNSGSQRPDTLYGETRSRCPIGSLRRTWLGNRSDWQEKRTEVFLLDGGSRGTSATSGKAGYGTSTRLRASSAPRSSPRCSARSWPVRVTASIGRALRLSTRLRPTPRSA